MELNFLLIGECQGCQISDPNQYLVCHTPEEVDYQEYDDAYALAIEKDSIWCCSECSEIAEEFVEGRKACKCGSTEFSLVKLPF